MKRFLACLLLVSLTLLPLAAQKSEKVVAATQETALTVVQSGKTLQLQNATVGEKLEVLSIVGVRIIEKKIDSTSMNIALDLPKGYYIIKIGTVVRKISMK